MTQSVSLRVRRPPGPKIRFPRTVWQGMLNVLPLLEAMASEYGDIAYLDAGHLSFYFVNDPDLIRDILVTHGHQFTKSRALEMSKLVLGEGLLTSEGAVHRRQRRC
ncbi:MAG: cytochrome P450, partial [Abitibacteriaceae bacterium]|nr:cytochrome P450 [Abditibacteriaceae bacterium]